MTAAQIRQRAEKYRHEEQRFLAMANQASGAAIALEALANDLETIDRQANISTAGYEQPEPGNETCAVT